MNVIAKFLAVLLIGITTAAHAQTGNVGIGTTTPNAKLHVNGDLQVNDLPSVTNATQSIVLNPNTGKFAKQTLPPSTPVRIHAKTNVGTFSSGSASIVTWTSTSVNTVTSAWNGSSGVFTAPRTGLYEVSASLFYQASSDNRKEYSVSIYKSSTRYAVAANYDNNGGTDGYKPTSTVHAVVPLNAGEQITIRTYHNADSNRSLHNSRDYNWVNIIEL